MTEEKKEKKEKKDKKSNIKAMLKDKKGKAKLELMVYLIFFIGVIIFARVLNFDNNKKESSNIENSFIYSIEDNYAYEINITIDDNIYHYYGQRLGYNNKITRQDNEEINTYYKEANQYYVLDSNNNYILTTINEVYPYIDYRYLNIDNIKNYLKVGTKENNIYKVKLSNIILNNTSDEEITITVSEIDKSLIIDYTNLYKLNNESTYEVLVSIKYTNINNITSLEK